MFKNIIKIVVSVSLATIVSCSSVKKTKTTSTRKEDTTKVETSKNTITEAEKKDVIGVASTKIQREGVIIDYTPEFDSNGKLVPFSFKSKSNNGNETSVDIVGNANVKYYSESQVEDMVSKLQEAYIKNVDSLAQKVTDIKSNIKEEDKTKEKAPDYIKFIIWLVVGIVFLFGIIIVMYFYFKKQISSFTQFLPKND